MYHDNKTWRYVLQPNSNEFDRQLLLDIHEQNEQIINLLKKKPPKKQKKPGT